MKKTLLLTFIVPLAIGLGGCSGNQDSVPGHTAAEDQAINAEKNMTPQQKIDQIQKGAMPESAKAAMIQKIKDENGIK